MRLLGAVALVAAMAANAPTLASAYTFKLSNPVQCNNATVEWNGGKPPFNLVIVPTIEMTGGRIMNVSLPATGQPPYKYDFQMVQPAGLEFLAVMSDSTGWGSGGISDVLSVRTSPEQQCLKSIVKADFWFWTEPKDNPPMCSDMKISWEPNATYPVGLYGVIPGGTAWEIPVEKTRTRLTSNWTVNIQDGTRFILLMGDAGPYGTGGSTIPLTVQYSTDKSCINATSPKSTTSLPPHPSTSATSSPSSSPSSIPSSSASSSPTKSKSSSPVGAIVGGVIGGIAALALLALLLFCCRRRKKAESSSKHEEPASRQGLLGLRAPVPGRFSGHSRNSNGTDLRPRSWEIDAAGGSPDGLSDMGHDRDHSRAPEVLSLDPYPYTPPTTNRDSMFSSATEDSSSAWASTAGQHPPPQRTPKEVPVGVALSSRGTSTRHPSISSPMVAARPAPSVGNLSELNAVETGTPGQVLVDRDDLIAMLDPPPTYKPFEQLRSRNPDNGEEGS